MKSLLAILILVCITLAMAETPAPEKAATAPEMKHDTTSILYDWQNRQRPIPDEYVFQTKYLGGTQIVFNHKKHVNEFKLECIRCHHVESCTHCHSKDVKTIDVSEAKVALHENCFACHKTMSCVDCHHK